MKSITQNTYSLPYKTAIRFTFLTDFFSWCKSQEKNRLGWLALSLASHGCLITPVIVLAVTMTGNNLILWMAAMIAMGITLIVNLAALPTKITIPTFVLSIIIDIAILITCIIQYAGGLNT
jgi:hypothetical protein